MSDYKSLYDIFICGGSEHFEMLRALLPKLYVYGTIHLGSIVLNESELRELSPYYDVVHFPVHHTDGYTNFELFCIRDINRLASAPYFIKLDADIHLEPGWIEYVNKTIEEYEDAVLFGPTPGATNISVELSGPLVRRRLGKDILVSDGRKVIGGFYVGKTGFFKRYDPFMQILHELIYCFEDGIRVRPSMNPQEWPQEDERIFGPFTFKGHRLEWGNSKEDVLRNLVAHAVGAGDGIVALDGGEKIRVFKHGYARLYCEV